MYIASVAQWPPTYTFMRIFDLSSKFLSRGNVVHLAVYPPVLFVCHTCTIGPNFFTGWRLHHSTFCTTYILKKLLQGQASSGSKYGWVEKMRDFFTSFCLLMH